MTDLQKFISELRRRQLANMISPPRFYRVRESALATASYDVLIRSRGPMGRLTREAAQAIVLKAGLGLGIVWKDAGGNFHLVGVQQ